jgi:hypothetical protein
LKTKIFITSYILSICFSLSICFANLLIPLFWDRPLFIALTYLIEATIIQSVLVYLIIANTNWQRFQVCELKQSEILIKQIIYAFIALLIGISFSVILANKFIPLFWDRRLFLKVGFLVVVTFSPSLTVHFLITKFNWQSLPTSAVFQRLNSINENFRTKQRKPQFLMHRWQLGINNQIIQFIIRKRIIEIFLFLLTFFISCYFSTIGADPHHDGIMFKPAIDVASGQMLFRDTKTTYGALTTLLQAASLILFGKYLITIKILTAFFYGLISIFIYQIFTEFIPRALVFITVIIWLFMATYFVWTLLPWSSVYSLFFQLLGAYLLILSLKYNSRSYLMFSGIATSLTFWCRQPVGVFMFLAIIVFFLCLYFLRQISFKELNKNILIFIFGNFIVCLSFLIWLFLNNAIKDWWLQSIVNAFLFANSLSGESLFSTLYRNLLPASKSPISVWTLLPLSTFLLTMKFSIKLFGKSEEREKQINILAICFISLASWLQYHPVPDIRHLYWAGTPMFGLFSLFLFTFVNEFINGNSKLSSELCTLATILLIICSFYNDLNYRISSGFDRTNQSYYTIKQPIILKNMRLTKTEADGYKNIYFEIENYLDKNPDGNIINLGRDALYNTFDPNIYNIHPVYIVGANPNPLYPDYFDKVFAFISENHPLFLTNEPLEFPDYCQHDINGPYSTMYIHLPCESLPKK